MEIAHYAKKHVKFNSPSIENDICQWLSCRDWTVKQDQKEQGVQSSVPDTEGFADVQTHEAEWQQHNQMSARGNKHIYGFLDVVTHI